MRDLENCQLPSKFCSFCSIKGNGITRIDDIREITDENDKKEWALDKSLGTLDVTLDQEECWSSMTTL